MQHVRDRANGLARRFVQRNTLAYDRLNSEYLHGIVIHGRIFVCIPIKHKFLVSQSSHFSFLFHYSQIPCLYKQTKDGHDLGNRQHLSCKYFNFVFNEHLLYIRRYFNSSFQLMVIVFKQKRHLLTISKSQLHILCVKLSTLMQ